MKSDLEVTLISRPEFLADNAARVGEGWTTDAAGAEALAEFAGRSCFASWRKPNPKTATNAGYLAHIREVGHLSVIEHGNYSVYVTGFTRSGTHEGIRHRAGFAYSQRSQRYTDESTTRVLMPDDIAEDDDLREMFEEAADQAQATYAKLVDGLQAKYTRDHPGWTKTHIRKAAREKAREILPNGIETGIVITGNCRAWRHFITMRGSEHADTQIRGLAVAMCRILQDEAPNIFGDFTIAPYEDGTEIATTTFTEVH